MTNTVAQWQQAKPILDEALDLAPGDRQGFVIKACGADRTMIDYLLRLLAADDEQLRLFENPALAKLEQVFADETLHSGDVLGKYHIVRLLGSGGMGKVYAAERKDKHFTKPVAVKVLDRIGDHDKLMRHFRKECHILAKLDHPHIARIRDGGFTTNGQPYMVMDLIKGVDLSVYLSAQRPDLPRLLQLFETICNAVQFAHRNLIVHRDLKPANVLVDDTGAPTLLDFGISSLLDPGEVGDELTRLNERRMTPEYASPEQWRNDSITTATDVYALGVMLFQALTGSRPYDLRKARKKTTLTATLPFEEAPTMSPLLRRSGRDGISLAKSAPYSASQLRGDLDAIVAKALALRPEERYSSPDHLAADLRRCRLGHAVKARRQHPWYLVRTFFRRHRFSVSLAGSFILGLMMLTLALFNQRNATSTALATAQRENARASQLNEVALNLFRRPDPYQRVGSVLTVKELAEEALFEMPEETLEQVDIKTELLVTFGQALIGMGLLENAADRLEQVEILAKKRLPHDHPRIAKILTIRASAFFYLSQIDKGYQLLQEATAHQKNYLPVMHPNRIRTLQCWGYYGLFSQKFSVGQRQLVQALQIHKHFPNRLDLDPSLTHNLLATTLASQGALSSAEIHAEEGLRIRTQQWGYEHPTVADSLITFGLIFDKGLDRALSETMLEEALRIQEARFRPCHPFLVQVRNQTANHHFEFGHFSEAATLHRQNLVCAENDTGSCFFAYVFAWSNLGNSLLRLNRLDEAQIAYHHFHEMVRETNGESSALYADSLTNLALVANAQNQQVRASVLTRQAMSLFVDLGMKNATSMGYCLAMQAEWESEAGRPEAAMTLAERALPILENALNPKDPYLIDFLQKRDAWHQALSAE